ncbi:MAG: hypothetical protein H0U87_05715 [Acidobacteria bacterium]|jgi:hypothetical protein|nr:hypothetical protein [Acidobacteriota bacterium]
MRFNDDGQTDSNIDESFYGANQNDSGGGEFFTTMFDREWDRLASENARPLIAVKENFKEHFRVNQNIDFKSTDRWVEAAQMLLLPFHGFASEYSLVIDFKRKLADGVNLNVMWMVSYMHSESGSAGLYAADLLLIKRRIYEQGTELKNSLEINLEAELAPFIEKYQEVEVFQRLFQLSTAVASELYINNKDANKTKGKFLNECSNRFEGSIERPGKSKNGSEKTVLRVGLNEYWLDWVKVARRAEFDFDYLSRLEPIEMRFYELTQLLRFLDGDKALCVIKKAPLRISYGEFTKLMPLPPVETYEQIENQMNELCRVHLESGFLETITIKSINRNETFADADLEMVFKN